MRVVEPFAEFCAKTELVHLPNAIIEDAKAKIVDAIACGYAGREHETATIALQLAKRLPAGNATVAFDGARLSAADAAFVNSAIIHGILQDDVDLESGHPACTV